MLDASPPSDRPCAHCGGAGDWRAEQLAILRELTELNMRLARVVVARAEAGAEPETAESAPIRAPDPSLALSRLSRAVRLTLSLEARLRGEVQGVADAATNAEAARLEKLGNEDRQRAREIDSNRDRVISALDMAVDLAPREALERPDAPDSESLLELVLDRIDGLSDDILFDVPEGVLIERLCAEFGLDPDPDVMADRYEDKLWKGWELPQPEEAVGRDAPQERALELSS